MKKRFLSALWLTLIFTSVLLLGGGSCFAALEPSQPLFPNAKLLVSAVSLESSMGESGLVIIDARTSGYETAHIPGAINVKFGDYFTSGTGLLPLADLQSKLGAAGLTRGMTFVIYDNTSASWGAAGRIFWMLEYLGCTRAHILDGGWDKWVADARQTEVTVNTLPKKTFTAALKPAVKTDKAYIESRLGAEDFVVIDSRTDEEFIGWQLYGEARGGHIPGAVQIPYNWHFNADRTIRDVSWINSLLLSRGITKDKEVTAHCTVGIRSGFAYFILRLMGYPLASNYDASIVEWAKDKTLPMEKAPRFSTIVYPAWVKALIAYHAPGSTTAAPPNYPYARDHKYVIFETSWGPTESATSYKNGHVPGAVHSDSDIYENGSPRWFLKPIDEIHTVMGNLGITADTTVVVYADSPSYSARLWWVLKYAGLKDVRYFNGGYQQWLTAGYAGETKINNPTPATFAGAAHASYLATTPWVAKNLNSIWVGDVRSYDEHLGAKSGYNYISAKGRIPGAIWLNDGGSTQLVYRDGDATISAYTQVRDNWTKKGIVSTAVPTRFDKELVFHCGNGYRSSLTFLHAYLMGYNNVRNYSSGWSDWSTTYTNDPSCGGITPGWCQEPSPRQIVIEMPAD
ncbi:MAG: rhodanese-like domain-containing protein [Syntrophobacteraceae bacterium]